MLLTENISVQTVNSVVGRILVIFASLQAYSIKLRFCASLNWQIY